MLEIPLRFRIRIGGTDINTMLFVMYANKEIYMSVFVSVCM